MVVFTFIVVLVSLRVMWPSKIQTVIASLNSLIGTREFRMYILLFGLGLCWTMYNVCILFVAHTHTQKDPWMCIMGSLGISIVLTSFYVALILDSKPDLAVLLEEVGQQVLGNQQAFVLQLGVRSSVIKVIENTEKENSKTCI